jgi:hypothetical protein
MNKGLILNGGPRQIQKAEDNMGHSKSHDPGANLTAYRFTHTGDDQAEPGDRQAGGRSSMEHSVFEHLKSPLFIYCASRQAGYVPYNLHV